MMEAGGQRLPIEPERKGEDHMDPAKREDYTEMLLAEGGKARCTCLLYTSDAADEL